MSVSAPAALSTRSLASAGRLLGTAGVLASLAAGVGAGAHAWKYPITEAPTDRPWLAFYAVLLLGSAALCWLGRGRWLLLAVAAGLVGLLLASLLQPGAAAAYGAVLVMLIVAGGVGARLLRRLAPSLAPTRLERLLLGQALGLGTLSLLTLALGLLGQLKGWLLWGLLIAALVGLAPALVRASRDAYTAWASRAHGAWCGAELPWVAMAVSVLAVAAFGGWLWALAPSVHFDALVYHLGVPVIYVDRQAIVEVTEEFRAYWVHNGEMLYTLSLVLAGQPAPGLIHLAAGVLTAGLVFAGGRRLGGPRVGLSAAVLFYTVPLVTGLSGTAYIDLLVGFYGAALAYAALAWVQDGDDAWLTVGGVLAGLGLGTKLNIGLLVVPLGALVAYGVWVRYRLSRRGFAALLRFGLPALLAFAPWLARDFAWTGNPIFPYFNAVFRSPDWAATNTFFNFADFGRGDGLVAFLRLPWDLTRHTPEFMEVIPVGYLGTLPLLALPWLYLRGGPAPRRVLWGALLYCLGVCALWFRIGPYLRYIVPLCPVLAVLAALNLEPLWNGLQRSPRPRLSMLAGLLLITALAGATRASHLRSLRHLPERYPYRVALGLEPHPDFIQRAFGPYAALQFLNEQGTQTDKVLTVHQPFRLYSRRPLLNRISGGVPELIAASTEDTLAAALYGFGVRHLLLLESDIKRGSERTALLYQNESFLNQSAELIFSHGAYRVYRLLPPAEVP